MMIKRLAKCWTRLCAQQVKAMPDLSCIAEMSMKVCSRGDHGATYHSADAVQIPKQRENMAVHEHLNKSNFGTYNDTMTQCRSL